MTSAIISSTIDADFPIAGQDNDSQGFRDNFDVIKTGLAVAASEITVLQNTSAKLNTDNDFGGNVIGNAVTNRVYGTVYTTTSTGTTNISLENGEYQSVTITNTGHVLTFTDWPETERYAKIRLQLQSNGGGNHTVNFSSAGGGVLRKEFTQALATATGAEVNASSGATTAATISFPTANLTGVFSANDRLFGTGLSGSATISSVTNLIATATATTAPTTLTYTSINGAGLVTTSSTAAGVVTGSKVILSNTTGIQGLSTVTTYYAFGASGSGFSLASTPANAAASIAVAGLSGTIAYTTLTVLNPGGAGETVRVTTATSAAGLPLGNAVTLSDVTGVSGLLTATTYYIYGQDATGFSLATSYANALSGTGVTGASGSFSGTGTATHSGAFSGSATATFAELNPNANRVTVSSTTGMYVGMPIKFTGTGFGGVTSGTDYYILEVIDGTGLRLSTVPDGAPVTLTTATGTLTMVPRTKLAVSLDNSQTITRTSGLNITTADSAFPDPFVVSIDVNKSRFVEAWTADGGDTIFMKYLGEYA